MKLSIDGITLKEVIKNMKDLINEVDMKIDNDGLSIITMDPANVAMVIFKLPAKSCIEFVHTDGEDSFGIDLTNFSKLLKRTKKDDILILETTDAKMKMKIGTGRTFTMPKIEIEDSVQKIPELKYLSSVTLDRKDLLDAVGDVNIVADSTLFTLSKDSLTLSGEGELMSAKNELSKIEIEYKDEKETLKSKYAIEYLQKMLTAPAEKVKIETGNEYPIRITFKNDIYDLMYICAPRIDSDD